MNDSSTMEPAGAALAVLEELKRQRSEGTRHLYMEESTLQGLEELLAGGKKESPPIAAVPDKPRFDQVSNPLPWLRFLWVPKHLNKKSQFQFLNQLQNL